MNRFHPKAIERRFDNAIGYGEDVGVAFLIASLCTSPLWYPLWFLYCAAWVIFGNDDQQG